jgi:shikimate kinase
MGNIYLVGFMGTGKTAVGGCLAKKKRWRFLDLDELIELREKRTINDIFANNDEAYFRRLERNLLKEVSKEKKFVIACGGGIVLNEDNIKVMRQTGKIICLNASVDAILKRTSKDSQRPLLNVADQKQRIETLLKFRRPFYEKADFSIDTSRLNVKEVVKKISSSLNKKSNKKK